MIAPAGRRADVVSFARVRLMLFMVVLPACATSSCSKGRATRSPCLGPSAPPVAHVLLANGSESFCGRARAQRRRRGGDRFVTHPAKERAFVPTRTRTRCALLQSLLNGRGRVLGFTALARWPRLWTAAISKPPRSEEPTRTGRSQTIQGPRARTSPPCRSRRRRRLGPQFSSWPRSDESWCAAFGEEFITAATSTVR